MAEKLPFETVKRKVLVKKQAKANPDMGCDPNKRTIPELIKYGIVNIDKPKGPTSHQVSSYVQKILGVSKAGHSGTLDPRVTGVLPIALAQATKTTQTLLKAGKEYVCIMHLHKAVDEKKIRAAIKSFIGEITQLPPIKSAVKREERQRTIYYIKVIEIDGQDVLFKVGCQAGTYIRKLCLHPQTNIWTKNGFISASDFFLDCQTVYSHNEGMILEKNPSATQKIQSPSKLIKVTMASGIDIIVTPDHELLTSSKKGYKMMEAQALKKGDFLAKSLVFPDSCKKFFIADLLDDEYYIQQEDIKQRCKKAFIAKYGSIREMYRKLKLDRKAFLSKSSHAISIKHLKLAGIYEEVKRDIHTFKTQKGTVIRMKELNEDFFNLLGLIASDGNNTKEKKTTRYTRIKFHNKEEVLIDNFLKRCQKLFPSVPISKKSMKNNLWEVDTANSFLATIAASLGIRSPQKNSDLLPVVNAGKNLVRAFLKGYFDGDGSAYYKQKEDPLAHHTNIRFHTGNSRDANRIHTMLLKVGIPNKIFSRRVKIKGRICKIFDISVETLAGKNKFIREVGSDHPLKKAKFEKISSVKDNYAIDDHYYVGFHFKEEIRKNKAKLHKMGGNLTRILSNNIPVTKGFYRKASKIVNIPKLDDFIIEKIKSIEIIKGTDYVYDMTVPGTHNFLIATGFVSSNCHDLGEKLECGAHMAELRRTKAGPFQEDTLVTLHDLQDAWWYYKNKKDDKRIRKVVQPMENAITHIPKVWVLDTAVSTMCHGADLKAPGLSKVESDIIQKDMVAVMTLKEELIALGVAQGTSSELVAKEKGVVVKIEKVFMEPELYKKVK